MELYFAMMTTVALFFVFDSISLRLERNADEQTICDLVIDLDWSLERIESLETALEKSKAARKKDHDKYLKKESDNNAERHELINDKREEYNNYQTMAYKRRKFENFLVNFKEGDGLKIDDFLKKELSKNKYLAYKNS